MIRFFTHVFCRGWSVPALVLAAALAGGCVERYATFDQVMAEAKQEREKGNYGAALIHLKNAAQKSPENAQARYLLGLTYNDTGDFSSGEKELRRALELNHDPAQVIPPLGRALLALGEYQKVLDVLRVEDKVDDRLQAEILTLRALALL